MGLCWWQRVVALCIAEQVGPHGVGGAPDHEGRTPSCTKDAKGSAKAKSNASSVVLCLFTKYKFLLVYIRSTYLETRLLVTL